MKNYIFANNKKIALTDEQVAKFCKELGVANPLEDVVSEIEGVITNPKYLIISDPYYIGRDTIYSYIRQMPDGEYSVRIQTKHEARVDDESDLVYDALICDIGISKAGNIPLWESGKLYRNSSIATDGMYEKPKIFIGTAETLDDDKIASGAISAVREGWVGDLYEITSEEDDSYDCTEEQGTPIPDSWSGTVVTLEFLSDKIDETILLQKIAETLGIKQISEN